jgi:hypothetical protein
VRGFYAIGATRIGVLDIALLLVLAAGLAAPLAHFALRRIMKRGRANGQDLH